MTCVSNKLDVVRRGFTLAEVVIVLVMLAILWAIAAPRYAYSMSRYRAEAAARRLAADLNLARATARQTSASVVITFDTTANAYTMTGVQSLDHTSVNATVNLAADPYLAVFVSLPFTSNQLVFNAYGMASAGGQLVLQSGGLQRTVLLEATTGKAVVQ